MSTPNPPKRTHLDQNTQLQWSKHAQLFMLDSLMAASGWTTEDIVFHGGTSLHMSWNSPRFSEDLDFLLNRQVDDLEKIMRKSLVRVQEHFMAIDPAVKVELKDLTRDANRMPCYHLQMTKPGVMGKAMVKVEFWRVDREYLDKYPTQYRKPNIGDMGSRLSHPVPAADLSTAYCDKLTAFATRPFLKWRDVHDLWWIGTQSGITLDPSLVKEQFLHNVSAYKTPDGQPPQDALRRFLVRPIDEVIAAADPDLKLWLPPEVWRRINPHGVREMVEYTRHALGVVADLMDQAISPEAVSLNRLPRP